VEGVFHARRGLWRRERLVAELREEEFVQPALDLSREVDVVKVELLGADGRIRGRHVANRDRRRPRVENLPPLAAEGVDDDRLLDALRRGRSRRRGRLPEDGAHPPLGSEPVEGREEIADRRLRPLHAPKAAVEKDRVGAEALREDLERIREARDRVRVEPALPRDAGRRAAGGPARALEGGNFLQIAVDAEGARLVPERLRLRAEHLDVGEREIERLVALVAVADEGGSDAPSLLDLSGVKGDRGAPAVAGLVRAEALVRPLLLGCPRAPGVVVLVRQRNFILAAPDAALEREREVDVLRGCGWGVGVGGSGDEE
jgi:hypothetical protein